MKARERTDENSRTDQYELPRGDSAGQGPRYAGGFQQARDLDTLADKVRSTANDKVEQSMQVLSSGWKGNNATEFLRKYGQLKQQILDSAKELNAIADDIRRTAKIVYDAEMAALRIAQTRKA